MPAKWVVAERHEAWTCMGADIDAQTPPLVVIHPLSSDAFPSTVTASTDIEAWLAQAERLRAKALRLERWSLAREWTVSGEPEQGVDLSDRAYSVDEGPELMADYLAESEKIARLMKQLARTS